MQFGKPKDTKTTQTPKVMVLTNGVLLAQVFDFIKKKVVPPTGFEPVAPGLGKRL